MRVIIAGTGKCLPGQDVPGRVVSNDEVVGLLLANKAIKPGTDRPWEPGELTSQKISDLVGIRERRWVTNDLNTSDLALAAAEQALGEAGIGWEDIGILAVGSSTPEALFPSTACLVLYKAIKKKVESGAWDEQVARAAMRIPAFDILAACTSGLYAIDLVRKHLMFEETASSYGLAVSAEVFSRMLDFSDTNSDLWGDAAGAVVLKRAEGPAGIICTEVGSDPWRAETTYSVGKDMRYHEAPDKPNAMMKGHEVQKFVLKIIPELIERTIAKANRFMGGGRRIGVNDIALFICHQANARIFDHPSKKLGIPLEKFYVNVGRRGNTSSASVLLALREAYEDGRIRKGDLVMLLSFGGGLTWAAMIVEW
jgi:3-oxoacyl-[acyl-carrier-protein] synthase III